MKRIMTVCLATFVILFSLLSLTSSESVSRLNNVANIDLIQRLLKNTAKSSMNVRTAKIIKNLFGNPESPRQAVTIPPLGALLALLFPDQTSLLTLPISVLSSVLSALFLASKFDDRGRSDDKGHKKKVKKVVYVPQEHHYDDHGWH